MVCEILASRENSLWTTSASWANAFRFGAGSSMIRRGRAQDLMQARREPGSDLPRTPHGRTQNLVQMRSGHDAVGVAFFLRPRESDHGRAAGEHRLRHRRRSIGRLEIARRPVLPAAWTMIRVEVCRKSEVSPRAAATWRLRCRVWQKIAGRVGRFRRRVCPKNRLFNDFLRMAEYRSGLESKNRWSAPCYIRQILGWRQKIVDKSGFRAASIGGRLREALLWGRRSSPRAKIACRIVRSCAV